MEWGKVKNLVEGGAIVELASGTRQKPMPVPNGTNLAVNEKVLVEKVNGSYLILGAYGGDADGE